MEKSIRLESGFIRPKKNGGWDSPFDPRVSNNFTEGNAWQYTFCATRYSGMIEAYGGIKI
jgi:putative alpha-1,2-mannosidase